MEIETQFIEYLMGEALREAEEAFFTGEVPVGAVVARNGKIIARAHNRTEHEIDCTAHAEILAMQRAAAQLGTWRLLDCILCVTLEPCTMCIGAIRLARIPALVFGAMDPHMGAVGSLYDLSQDDRLGPSMRVISGIRAEASEMMLKNFFKAQREKKAEKAKDSYWQQVNPASVLTTG